MAARKLEERLEQLKQLRTTSADEALVLSAVRRGLDDRSNLIVAEAAKLAGDRSLSSLIPDLLRAFDRLFDDPVKTDPKCWGKTAIAKALTTLDYSESPPFIRGSRHVQMEPVWGGREDAALQLRSTCVLALVQCTDLQRLAILRLLVDSLIDPGDPVRLEAVRAIEQLNGDEAGLLLRLKAHMGDRRPAVIGEAFDALLHLETEQAVQFIRPFLDGTDVEVRDEAALSLGSSRLAGAVDLLLKTWNETHDREFKPVLLRSLSASRSSSALDFLIDLVKNGSSRDSAAALDALQLHRESPEIQQLIEDAKTKREG